MKQTLQLKLTQHLTLTPQLQQSIRLLQLSTLELNQELERFLAENPLLERDEGEEDGAPVVRLNGTESVTTETVERSDKPDGPAAEDESRPSADDWSLETVAPGTSREDADDADYPQLAAESPSLRDHLLQQLSLTALPDRDRTLVALLVDALDEDGYLTQPLEEIAAMLPAELAIELRIVREHLPLLAARDFAKLKRLIGCDEALLRTAQRLIQSLNPRPGAAFAPLEARYVVADVIVRKVKGVWRASLNPDAMPKLRINRIYADILQSNRGQAGQLASQLQEARWLIKNVQQRFETIQRVSQTIVDRQRHFFDHGEVAMRPLVLREIADALGLHESTVSRVTTQKYMATPRGIFELKYFFGSHVATEAGGACSATAIRALIKQLVAAEDPKKPLSDSKISQILGQQGIVVARRTIAKYRESLHIPPVNLRKAL